MNNKILILSIINIFSAIGYSLIAPLFPSLASDKKIGENIIGLIISCFPLSDILSTIFVPYLIFKFTRKKNIYVRSNFRRKLHNIVWIFKIF